MKIPLSKVLLLAFACAARAVAGQSAATATAPAATQGRYLPPFNESNFWIPRYSLGPKLSLTLAKQEPPTPETVTKIKQSIADLADIDSASFGFSPTLSGSAFLPLPDQAHADAMLLTDHHLRASAELKALVEWGPVALPYLLDAIDDKTPTRLTITHDSEMGTMRRSNELDWNPVSDLEKNVFANYKRKDFAETERLKTHTVQIGDVCFVAIGEIVGRRYSAVRYQPTANIIINSPVDDPEMCQLVRAVWTSKDPRQRLFDSLLTDYATQAAFNGESLDGWDAGSQMQNAAAMRLLYYFPKESAPAIAERLDKLSVKRIDDIDASIKQDLANSVRAEDFIKAVHMSPEPVIRHAVRGIFDRTDDYEIALATLPAVDDKQLIKERLQAFLAKAPVDEHGAYGEGFNILVAAHNALGDDSAPLFESFVAHGSAQHAYSTAEALQGISTSWSDAILLRLLEDKRPFPTYSHGVSDPNDDKRLDIRVCDISAQSLQAHHPELKFEMVGTLNQMDAQIKAIKEQLSK